jgi:aspartate aminotransferase
MTDLLTRCSDTSLSSLAQGLIGSEVLKIAGEIRTLTAQGKSICNLTVGDFSPTEFRIPAGLEELIVEQLRNGQTNYPPSDGTMELRKAVVEFYRRTMGLDYPVESIVIAGGSRPIIFAAYAAVVDPGDKVIFPTPSWNNNHYTYLMRGTPVELMVGPETNFLPTAAMLRPHVRDARLICINTPLNPTGTVMAREEVEAIAKLVVEENERRASSGDRPLFLMWDQVYWLLTFGDHKHYAPPQLVRDAMEWTIFVDGISKAFAATGLRVGWTVAPPAVTSRMRDILGHVGAWAESRTTRRRRVPRTHRRDRRLPRGDDPRAATPPQPPVRRLRSDAPRRSAGARDRAAGRDLPLRAVRPHRPPADQ